MTGRAVPTERSRIEELYAISTLFTAFETIEKTLGAAVEIVARTLPLHSASVIEATIGARANLTIWATTQAANDRVEAAKAHVVEAYAYLAGTESSTELEIRESVIAGALPERPLERTAGPHRFIVIPLVVAKGSVFGALQLEGAEPLDRRDLMFANMVANQLAVALDRHRAWRYEIDQRTAAQAAREKYELLIDNLESAFVWEADASRQLSYASAQIERLLGYSRRDCLTEHEFWDAHVHPDDRDRLSFTFERALAERRGKRCEHRFLTANQEVRWLHTGIQVVDAGNRPRYQGVSMDITSSKIAEDRVREQLAFTKAMASSIGDGTIAIDLTGTVTFINAAAETLLQCAERDLRSTTGTALVRIEAEDGSAVEHPLDATIRTGASIRSDEHVLVRPDGGRFSVSYTATPIRRASTISGAVLAFDDISERKRVRTAEHFLLGASELLGASLETAAVLGALARVGLPQLGDLCFVDVLAADDDRLLRTAWAHVDPRQHAELERVYRMSPPVSFLIQPVARVVTAGRALLVPVVDEAWLEAAATSSADLSFCRSLGITSAMVIPLCAGKRQLGALTFYSHVHARRLTQEDLALAEELARRGSLALEHARLYSEARRAIGAREQMLAIVSHDLRTPLSTIVMASGLLREGGDDEMRILATEKIERAATRMDRLIGDLLDFASIEGGGLAMIPRTYEIPSIVEEAVTSFEELAKTQRVYLVAELAVTQGRVFGDRDRLLQVLGNLISNALKVTPKGGLVKVTVKTREREAVFAVSDSGPGIPFAEQARLFERYWRSPGASYKGTGLGLAIAQGIIEAHGGRMWVDSDVGCGATFFFTVPLAPDRGDQSPD